MRCIVEVSEFSAKEWQQAIFQHKGLSFSLNVQFLQFLLVNLPLYFLML